MFKLFQIQMMITTSKLKFMRAVLASENIFKTTPSKFPLNVKYILNMSKYAFLSPEEGHEY